MWSRGIILCIILYIIYKVRAQQQAPPLLTAPLPLSFPLSTTLPSFASPLCPPCPLPSPPQKGAATLAACNVYHCYKASPEYAAGLKLAPGELKRRTKALAAAMMVPLSPAPAPVEAPGTPPLAAAAAAAPEFSDAGSQEEVVEAAGPSGLVEQLVAMAQADKEVAAAQVGHWSGEGKGDFWLLGMSAGEGGGCWGLGAWGLCDE